MRRMLGLPKKLWAVIAFILIGLSALAARSCSAEGEVPTQAIAPVARASVPNEDLLNPLEGSTGTRQVAAAPETELGPEPEFDNGAVAATATGHSLEAEAEDPGPLDLKDCDVECGSVVGHVSSAETGQPLIRHGLLFSHEKLGVRRIQTGPDGYYQLDDLAPGLRTVSYTGPALSSGSSGFLKQGNVEVFANFVSEFSIQIQGRSLTGKFLRVDAHDGATLFLELRAIWDLETVVASVEATTYHSALKVKAEHPDMPQAELPSSELGAFELSGLLPDIYELRIVFGTDPESGEPFYMKQEVSLLQDDVDLGLRKFTRQDLALAALALKAEREASLGQ